MIPIIIGTLATASAVGYGIHKAVEEREKRQRQEQWRRRKEERRRREEEKRIIASGIAEIDSMTGKEFEKYISLGCRKIGYLTELTPDSQDYGADIILRKKGIKTVIQTKRWKNKVGVKAVQETIAAKQYYKAERGMVITNSFFTKNSINLAKSTGIVLWNRDKLIDFILQVKKEN